MKNGAGPKTSAATPDSRPANYRQDTRTMDHEYSKSDGGNWCALCGLPESDSNHFDPVDLTALVEELRTMNLISWRVACAHKFSDPAGLQRIDKLITERLGI